MADRDINDLISVYREENTIFFYDELDRVSIYALQRLMIEIYAERQHEELNIVIDSWGGHPSSIYNFIKEYPLEVNTYVMGFCCSGATLLHLAGDKRYISPTGLYLIHSHQGYIEEFQKEGNAEDNAHDIKTMNDIVLRQIYEIETKIPKKVLDDKLKYEDKFFTPKECLQYKIVDEIKSFSIGD